ncbi:MAG: ComEC/Rec2 family competence protein [Bacteroidota bacterium]
MNSWRPYPLLRLLFPFLAGIMIRLDYGFSCTGPPWRIPVLALLLVSAPVFSMLSSSYRYRWISGLMINGFFLLAGNEIAATSCASPGRDDFASHPGGLFLATVEEAPVLSKAAVKIVAVIRYRREAGRWMRTDGHALVYLRLNNDPLPLQYGDYILVKGRFEPIARNVNPHTFDYPGYLLNKGITHRGYMAAYSWKKIAVPPSGLLKRAAFHLRDRLLQVLRENRVEGREFAVASALLLGYVDELDAGLRRDYAATGAMHILSVSGMHVGIIYIFLEFLLGFLNKGKTGRFVKAVILLVFIWFYALLTGLSPAVLRSAAMLSLPILGKSMNRSPDMFNVVAASLFLILVSDPLLLLDVGFQLSYLAVAGIVILYKPIYDIYVTSAWLPDKIWSILAVSVSAQLATMPITLFTFHQFPNYFMLTNIFVVPLSSLIIYVGIFALVAGSIPVISLLGARVLVFLVWLLNSIIHFVEELPFSATTGIFISTPQMVLLYLFIAAGFLFLTRRRSSFLWLFLVALLVLNLTAAISKLERLQSARIVVFNASRNSLYEISCQRRALLFFNSTGAYDPFIKRQEQELVKADLDAHGIRWRRDYWLGRAHPDPEPGHLFLPAAHFGRFIQVRNLRIAVLNKKVPKGFHGFIQVDLLILEGNPTVAMAEAVKIFHPRQIVIDASNGRFRTAAWLREAAVLKVPCHAVTVNGAFEKEI